MPTLDELKKQWARNPPPGTGFAKYDASTLEQVIRSRVKKNKNAAMHYFWGAFVLEIIVYALLTHVMVRYGQDTATLLISLGGVLLFIPFTVVLMRQFKRLATTRPDDAGQASLREYVHRHYTLLSRFYRFKRHYEWVLIPLSSLIGVYLIFRLYVPGGVAENPLSTAITLVVTLVGCGLSIRKENKKNLEQPLHQLQELLDQFDKPT